MPYFRIRTIRTRDVEAWQWFPTGHADHPGLPEDFDVVEHPDGSCLVAKGEGRERSEHRAEIGDWIVFDPTFGLRTVVAEDFARAYRPVDTEDEIAEGPEGPDGHRRAHEQAAQIIGRLVGILHREHTRFDVDRDLHRLVAYLDYLADEVGHARRVVRPMARLRDALEPNLQDAAGRVHQNDLVYGAINLYLADGMRVLTDVEFTCRLRDLEDARRMLVEPPPLSAEQPESAGEPARESAEADLADVEPDEAVAVETPDRLADVGELTIVCPECDVTVLRVPGRGEYTCPECGCTFTDESPEPDEES